MTAGTVLDVEGLTVRIETAERVFDAVSDVSFSARRGETFALVGESGSGKSMTALAIMRLLPERVARIETGRIEFAGGDLAALRESELQSIRGNRAAMIFQEPMTSLNPSMRVGKQIAEVLQLHRGMSRAEALAEAEALFAKVRIPDPKRRLSEFPHRMSGGMRQRVMIALALTCKPDLLIADEPTTALDVTTQAQILKLFVSLQAELGAATILITHDLAVVAETADRVAVMYAGRIVEEAPVLALFDAPLHPYTRGLLVSIPHVTRRTAGKRERLAEIEGQVPPLWALPPGCAFAPRCPGATERCRVERPPLRTVRKERRLACFHEPVGEVAP